jgi:FKBP-type peptidyl-prolyl cis-trans isomerase (trigger factor)
MATVTRENIGLLNDKLVVKVAKDDYLPSFEKAIKEYSKKANIPGFRKGMVPAGMVKKMHGGPVFRDEVIKSVEKGLTDYLATEKLDIFAQPLPMAESDAYNLDMNNPAEYTFAFEVGLKSGFQVADLAKAKITNYKVTVTDAMIDEAIERERVGNKKAVAEGEEEQPVEKAELNEEFFNTIFPGKEIKTEADFRNEVKQALEQGWNGQAKNQLFDQIYHALLDNTTIEFPQDFLKRWMQNGGEQPKTAEEAEKEYPSFINQLKWTLITDKLVQNNNIEVKPDEIKDFAINQLLGYLGGRSGNKEDLMKEEWVINYLDKMMKDRKFIEDTYHRLQTDKVFAWAEGQVKPTDQGISVEEFKKMQEEHHHHH